MTWFGINSAAQLFAEPESCGELAELLDFAKARGLLFRVLGDGANSLMPDGLVEGVTVRLRGPEFERVEMNGDVLVCGAGGRLGKVIASSIRKGFSGLEWLAGVPASIGGAAVCNAGGRRGDIGQWIEWADTLDGGGRIHRLSRAEIVFGYRTSSLVGHLVVAVGLKLRADNPALVRQRFVSALREKKATQPLNRKSAGCAFKNPRGISARYLIADAGLCGICHGGASISPLHPNFICVEPTVTSADIRSLMAIVRDEVFRRTGILLEPEVHFW